MPVLPPARKLHAMEYPAFVATAPLLFGVLAAVSLLLEAAYRFDLFGRAVILWAPVVLLLGFLGALFSLSVLGKLTVQRSYHALTASALIIAAVALLLWAICLPYCLVTRSSSHSFG
jgi:hypothetical protein